MLHSTATCYAGDLKAFEDWSRVQGIVVDYGNVMAVQAAMLTWFDHLFAGEGMDCGSDTKAVAALGPFFPAYTKGAQNRILGGLQLALVGWASLAPGGANRVSEGKRDMAVCTLLALDTYLRLGTIHALQRRHIIPMIPSLGPGGRFRFLCLHRQA